jgi:hypothetical protein
VVAVCCGKSKIRHQKPHSGVAEPHSAPKISKISTKHVNFTKTVPNRVKQTPNSISTYQFTSISQQSRESKPILLRPCPKFAIFSEQSLTLHPKHRKYQQNTSILPKPVQFASNKAQYRTLRPKLPL